MGAPTIVGEAETVVRASPAQVLDFVLDLHRYREADHKIGRVGEVHRDGDRGTAWFSGRLRGLPGPGGTYPFTITGNRLAFGSPTDGLIRLLMASFDGSFECVETPEGTRVTHREEFGFRRPWRWIANPLLRSWLAEDTATEMARLKEILDAEPATPAADSSGGT